MSAKEVGLRLQKARKKQEASLEQAAHATRIRRHYLHALENGELEKLPSPAHVRGFLRAYSSFLNLDAEEILALLEPPREESEAEADEGIEEPEQEAAADAGPPPGPPPEFAEIGAELRQRRELLDLSLGEAEERTHISERYILRLESGDLENFPSPTQARGMLHNYAQFLGLEGEDLLLRYAEGIQRRFRAQQPEVETRVPRLPLEIPEIKLPQIGLPRWVRRYISPDTLVVGLLSFGLVAFFVWGITQVGSALSSQGAEPTAPALGEALAPSETPTPESTPVPLPDEGSGANGELDREETPQATATQITIEVANPGGLDLQVAPNQRVWVRVTVDGALQFEGRMAPDQTYTFSATNEILIYTGNAAALRVFLNGSDLGIMGIEGEVASLLFSPLGLATPTPSPEPTFDAPGATATAEAGLTPEATETVDAGEEAP